MAWTAYDATTAPQPMHHHTAPTGVVRLMPKSTFPRQPASNDTLITYQGTNILSRENIEGWNILSCGNFER